jgi:hypothetical protein
MEDGRTPLIVGGVIVIMVGVIGSTVYFTSKGVKKNAPVAIGDDIPLLAVQHIDQGASHIAYNSNPPTSGQHYFDPAPAGVYTQQPADETLVHNLEHGYVWISYSPEKIDVATVGKMASLVKSYPKVVMTPRPGNDSPIALAGWGKLIKLDAFDEGKIVSFIKLNRPGNAPEPNAK